MRKTLLRLATRLWTLPLRLGGVKLGSKLIIYPRSSWPARFLKNITIRSGVEIGQNARLNILTKNGSIYIGSGTRIEQNFTATENVTVSRECLISYGVSLVGHKYELGLMAPTVADLIPTPEIFIGSRCFIGCYSIILPGVKLGNNCIVGAGSVVTKSFPAGSVIAGNPAKLIRSIYDLY